MALIFRRVLLTEAPDVVALVQANDADLVADYGSYVKRTVQDIVQMVQDGNAEVIGGFNGGVLQGANLFVKHPDGSWESLLTVTDPTLTAAQRLAGFWKMIQWVAVRAPTAEMWGRVRIGGRLDLALSQLVGTTRTEQDGYAIHRGVASIVAGGV